jgi:hypothetical protein
MWICVVAFLPPRKIIQKGGPRLLDFNAFPFMPASHYVIKYAIADWMKAIFGSEPTYL